MPQYNPSIGMSYDDFAKKFYSDAEAIAKAYAYAEDNPLYILAAMEVLSESLRKTYDNFDSSKASSTNLTQAICSLMKTIIVNSIKTRVSKESKGPKHIDDYLNGKTADSNEKRESKFFPPKPAPDPAVYGEYLRDKAKFIRILEECCTQLNSEELEIIGEFMKNTHYAETCSNKLGKSKNEIYVMKKRALDKLEIMMMKRGVSREVYRRSQVYGYMSFYRRAELDPMALASKLRIYLMSVSQTDALSAQDIELKRLLSEFLLGDDQ
uniref:hypothetical protein n=1 Tax=Candidatus Cryptobacteroides bacterium TaxID=3085639 RepID=UPI004028A5E1